MYYTDIVKDKMAKSKKSSKNVINNLVVISDTHCGCKLGLCPRDGIQLDDGGVYQPSKIQQQVWGMWEEFWGEWVPSVTHGEPYAVVHNGDAIDGVHHNSTTQISHNLGDQAAIAHNILKPVVEACEGRYYHIRGTEAHVGKSGVDEERLAKQLGAVPNEDGQFARYELWKEVGDGLVHLLHHIGTTSSSAHESSAVNAELTAEFVEACRWNERPPNVIVRSHRHRNIEIKIPIANHYAISVVTPGWQCKTPFAYKIAGARLAPPQFGGIIIRRNERLLYVDGKVWHLQRSRIE